MDGTKIHADASKRNAVSYQRLREIEQQLQAEVAELFALGEGAEPVELPEGLVVEHEIALRQVRLTLVVEAKTVLESQARECDAGDQAAYESKVRERDAQAADRGRPPRRRPPSPPRRARGLPISTISPTRTRAS